ncbi:MAG: Methyltransferase, partial [Candidatus Hydrogenedentes bacterium]|nr:Methyltransferase [Candidatus Hydrogenedentota bacterium]
MNSRQRVTAALNRQPVDRVPIFMWFHPSTARRLGAMLDIPAGKVGDAMGNDVHMTWVNNNYAMEGIVHEHDGEGHVDEWGIEWVKEGEYNQIVRSPLAGASPETVLGYRFPVECIDALVARMEPLMAGRDEYFIGVDVSPCVFEMYNRLRGMEEALLDLAAAPNIADTMLSRCADYSVALSEASCERYPVDWLWTGDDVAGQQSLMMGPDLWRMYIKPHLKRVTRGGVARGLPVAYHCCGALRDIIPDLIEIGIGI